MLMHVCVHDLAVVMAVAESFPTFLHVHVHVCDLATEVAVAESSPTFLHVSKSVWFS